MEKNELIIELEKEIKERFKQSFEYNVVNISKQDLLVITSKNGLFTDFELDYISQLAKKHGQMWYCSFLEMQNKLYVAITNK